MPSSDLSNTSSVVLGIAGNSPGYLSQTGEITNLEKQADARLPRALFPIFVDGEASLGKYPFSAKQLQLPSEPSAQVQMEPELALKLRLEYDTHGTVVKLQARSLTLINDATYRNKSVSKLSQKKNWGFASKGLASSELTLDTTSEHEVIERLRLCGFHKHQGHWYLCSQDVAVTDYHLFNEPLLKWINQRINYQQDSGVLHSIKALLSNCAQPTEITVAIGAPCYTSAGESHQLAAGDETLVIAYDSKVLSLHEIEQALLSGNFDRLTPSLCLHQHVVA